MVNEIEGQNSEFKENRGDEYFQWVCAFAKTDGGKLIIGLDDNGNFVDIKDSKKLSEDLPNKYSNILCIIPSVNSEKTLYRYLQKFVNRGLLKEIGEKKGRKYELP